MQNMQNKETTNIYLEVKDPQADKKSEKILNAYAETMTKGETQKKGAEK